MSTSAIDKLIMEVKKRPAIYSYTMAEHSDKKILDRCWKEVATELRCSVNECKCKWTCLRNSYARYLRNEKEAETLSDDSKKKKPWYRAEALSFLKHHMVLFRNGTQPKINDVSSESHEDSTASSRIFKSEAYSNENTSIDIVPVILEADKAPVSPSNFKFAQAQEKLGFEFRNMANESAPEIKTSPLVKYSAEVAEDANLTFFKSVLPDMQKLSKRRQRQLKQDFLVSLNNLLDEQESDA